ncbi:methyltransferase, FxLD system [Streptomyces gamaensis]|uniref:Protein-L-isoaspartate O-methyltransferase n=1 Tax=Streptomyces gamaensis TaxID=1763542 RepID=A0ABW0YXU9_9ACTN
MDTNNTATADSLRSALVAKLRQQSAIRTDRVAEAFLAVPRHVFAPEVPLEEAYALNIVVTKRNEHGITVSSVSAPQIQAMQLEQAELRPGMHVAEIGSGGVNAALMAELVGGHGEVTTIDIDADVTDRARRFLAEAGYGRVNVVTADGEKGCAEHALYDRIVVTVGSWDVPPAWVDQLADGGRLVVPLRMRGLTRSVAFEKEDDHLVSRSAEICGFVTMQGAGEHQERLLLLHGKEIGLRFDDDWPADPDLLNGALETDRAESWTGVTIEPGEPFDTLQMWLATALDGFCLLTVDSKLDTGLVAPQNKMACPAVVDGGSFAYLAVRKTGDEPDRPTFEFGVHAFGPDAPTLAGTMADQIRAWDRDHRGGPGPRIWAFPVETPETGLPEGRVVTKRHVRIIISWPREGQGAMHHPTEEKE